MTPKAHTSSVWSWPSSHRSIYWPSTNMRALVCSLSRYWPWPSLPFPHYPSTGGSGTFWGYSASFAAPRCLVAPFIIVRMPGRRYSVFTKSTTELMFLQPLKLSILTAALCFPMISLLNFDFRERDICLLGHTTGCLRNGGAALGRSASTVRTRT